MADQSKGILANWDIDDEAIADEMGHAISDALREHRRAGVPIAVWDWETDRVVIVPPEEIVIPDEPGEEIESSGTGNRTQTKPDRPASSASGLSQQSDKS